MVVPADGGDPAVRPAAPPGRPAAPWTAGGRRPGRWCRPARGAAPARPGPRCGRPGPTAGRRAPALAGRPSTARARARRWRWPPDSDMPLLADPGVEAPAAARDELRPGPPRSASATSPRPRPAAPERQVLPHAGGEQRRLLEGAGDRRGAARPGAGRARPRRRAGSGPRSRRRAGAPARSAWSCRSRSAPTRAIVSPGSTRRSTPRSTSAGRRPGSGSATFSNTSRLGAALGRPPARRRRRSSARRRAPRRCARPRWPPPG